MERTYGPPLPEGAPDDGVERGIAAFVICASLIRQFEFAQNVWINDRKLSTISETNATRSSAPRTERSNARFPKRPIRKKISRPAGLHHTQGRRVFLPPGPQGACLSRVSGCSGAEPEQARLKEIQWQR